MAVSSFDDVAVPPSLEAARLVDWSPAVSPLLFGLPGAAATLEDGYRLLDGSAHPVPDDLVPIAMADERSVACVVARPIEDPLSGTVVRWHLDDIPLQHQARLLDVDVLAYLESLVQEIEARDAGYRLMTERIFPDYERAYLAEERRPRTFVTRPVRLACQNVVAGLAAFAHDSSFDGLTVAAWQTCELPHVATHDANRAMTALLLCEAFHSGATMEVRFDGNADYGPHPEGAVPASLRRFARTRGIWLGETDHDRARITPEQARELFLSVTPMPDALRGRVLDAVSRGVVTPERICFTLMSQTWREVELDFLLATSSRTSSILSGGASVTDRGARQAESEIARAALLTGMLFRRLDSKDAAVGSERGVRVLEDNRHGVEWEVVETEGAVLFSGVPNGPLPWSRGAALHPLEGRFVAIPRTAVTAEAVAQARRLRVVAPVAIVLPADADCDAAAGVHVLHCPDRLGELDQRLEEKLTRSRVARA